MSRLLIFGNPEWFISAVLTDAALRLAGEHGIEVVGVCDAAPAPSRRGRAIARRVLAVAAKRAFDPDYPIHPPSLAFRDTAVIAREFGARVIVPPDRNVNHPAFVRMVAEELRPDWGLSLGCGQIFERELLAALRYPVNYHNGLLPAYRGIGATAWSMFHEESESGFTFHLMNERIDEGAILLQDAVPIAPDARVTALEWDKTRHAARQMGAVLEILKRRDPGRPQVGPSSYFSAAAWRRARVIDDPVMHTWRELERRLRIFDYLALTLGGTRYEVTKLRAVPSGRRPGALAFRTSDGVVAEPVRFLHLPRALYRLYRPWWPGRHRVEPPDESSTSP
jgi:methionyl-tRNA formyltransferase